MIKLSFTNAEVWDSGFGLQVNDKNLESIISEALGTRAGGLTTHENHRLKKFSSNSCDITITICPHDRVTLIETDNEAFHSVEEMEEDRRERLKEKIGEEESESSGHSDL